ncbi:MAG: acylphosphatase [Melioribacteraceae bacterium]|nr:acylphosphatase [Melioribacteraceae bacterium]
MANNCRAEIIVNGLVQGVGFRYFVYNKAASLGLKGYTKNLFSGEVLTVAEGEKYLIDELFTLIKIGPSHSHVKNAKIEWTEYKCEFTNFDIRH